MLEAMRSGRRRLKRAAVTKATAATARTAAIARRSPAVTASAPMTAPQASQPLRRMSADRHERSKLLEGLLAEDAA